jgi:hypothetical protein
MRHASKADMDQHGLDVRFVPKADITNRYTRAVLGGRNLMALISVIRTRQRTRHPMTVASIGVPVSTLCQAPLLHRHKNGMT